MSSKLSIYFSFVVVIVPKYQYYLSEMFEDFRVCEKYQNNFILNNVVLSVYQENKFNNLYKTVRNDIVRVCLEISVILFAYNSSILESWLFPDRVIVVDMVSA